MRRSETARGRKRRFLYAAGFALPLALCLVLGYQLEKYDHLAPGLPAAAAFFLLAVGLTAIGARALSARSPETARPTGGALPADGAAASPPASSFRRRFLLTWLVIAVPNLLVLLGVYPGFFVYDAQDELMEVVTRSFNTHHPLLHVLALGGTITGVHKFTDSWNLGIFAYLFLQMLLITAIYAFVLARLRTAGLRRPLRILFTLWYALFPTVVMYTLCSTKDGLFSAFTTLFVLELDAWLHPSPAESPESAGDTPSPDRRRPRRAISSALRLSACAVLMMLLRNNASYVMIVFALLLLASLLWTRLRKPKERADTSSPSRRIRLHLISIVIISFVIYIFANRFLIFVTRATNGEHQESISVAIQSLGRAYAYHPESFADEDRATLLSYLTEEGLRSYEPRDCDNLKVTFNNNRYESDPLSFWRLWVKIGRRHPGTYLTSWLLTSCGLWYPFTVQNVYQGHTVFTFTYTESSYFGYETELPGVRMSLIPPIDAFYRWLSLDATIQKIPLLSFLFAPAFWFWFYVWFAVKKLYQKRGSDLLPLVPLFLLWATYLIGPYALVRYALPFFTSLPVLALIGERRGAGRSPHLSFFRKR